MESGHSEGEVQNVACSPKSPQGIIPEEWVTTDISAQAISDHQAGERAMPQSSVTSLLGTTQFPTNVVKEKK